MPYRKEKLVNSMKPGFYQINLILCSKSNLRYLFFIVISRGPSAASKLTILKKKNQNQTNKRKHNHKTLSYQSGMCRSVFPGLLLTTFNSCSSATELLGEQNQTAVYMGLLMLITSVLCIYQQVLFWQTKLTSTGCPWITPTFKISIIYNSNTVKGLKTTVTDR